MKKLSFFAVHGLLLSSLLFVPYVDAQTTEGAVTPEHFGLETPGLVPGDFFYFLKQWRRALVIFGKRDLPQRIDARLRFTSEYLLELQRLSLSSSEKQAAFDQALGFYTGALEALERDVDKIPATSAFSGGKDALAKRFIETALLHARIFDQVIRGTPSIRQSVDREKSRAGETFGRMGLRFLRPDAFAQRARFILTGQEQSWLGRIKDMEVFLWFRSTLPDAAQRAMNEERESLMEAFTPPEEAANAAEALDTLSGDPRLHLEVFALLATRDLPNDIKATFAARQNSLEDGTKISEEILRERLQETEQVAVAFSTALERLKLAQRENPEIFGLQRTAQRHLALAKEFQSQEKNAPAFTETVMASALFQKGARLLGEKRRVPDEEKMSEEEKDTLCIALYDPVCGENGKTYSNRCFAQAAGVTVAHEGECTE